MVLRRAPPFMNPDVSLFPTPSPAPCCPHSLISVCILWMCVHLSSGEPWNSYSKGALALPSDWLVREVVSQSGEMKAFVDFFLKSIPCAFCPRKKRLSKWKRSRQKDRGKWGRKSEKGEYREKLRREGDIKTKQKWLPELQGNLYI